MTIGNLEQSSSKWSIFAFSYLGDVVYELWCRQTILLYQQSPPPQVHQLVVNLVCCQSQAILAKQLYPLLTEEEQKIFRLGKNMKPNSRPRNASVAEYRLATAFECVIGFWYLQQQQSRFEMLMNHAVIRELWENIIAPSVVSITEV